VSESEFGFDGFARKWVPALPAWNAAAERPAWLEAGSEQERRHLYMAAMERIGGDGVVFSEALRERVRREAAAGVPILELLDGLLRDPEVGDREKAAILFQRVFGVPTSRARFITSWQPSNRSPEAKRVLERVSLCVEDARLAGLWSPP
jgi:hypothetical protein